MTREVATTARELALRLLARREYGEQELVQRLVGRDIPPEIASQVVYRLRGEDLVSDARFTEALVRGRLRKGYGPLRIARDLRERGVDQAVIDAHLAPLAEEWPARLEDVRRKRFGAAMPDAYPERVRQARFLEYRGFSNELIRHQLF